MNEKEKEKEKEKKFEFWLCFISSDDCTLKKEKTKKFEIKKRKRKIVSFYLTFWILNKIKGVKMGIGKMVVSERWERLSINQFHKLVYRANSIRRDFTFLFLFLFLFCFWRINYYKVKFFQWYLFVFRDLRKSRTTWWNTLFHLFPNWLFSFNLKT